MTISGFSVRHDIDPDFQFDKNKDFQFNIFAEFQFGNYPDFQSNSYNRKTKSMHYEKWIIAQKNSYVQF